MNKTFIAAVLTFFAIVALPGCKSKEEEQKDASREALKSFVERKNTTHVMTVEEIQAQRREEAAKAKESQK